MCNGPLCCAQPGHNTVELLLQEAGGHDDGEAQLAHGADGDGEDVPGAGGIGGQVDRRWDFEEGDQDTAIFRADRVEISLVHAVDV